MKQPRIGDWVVVTDFSKHHGDPGEVVRVTDGGMVMVRLYTGEVWVVPTEHDIELVPGVNRPVEPITLEEADDGERRWTPMKQPKIEDHVIITDFSKHHGEEGLVRRVTDTGMVMVALFSGVEWVVPTEHDIELVQERPVEALTQEEADDGERRAFYVLDMGEDYQTWYGSLPFDGQSVPEYIVEIGGEEYAMREAPEPLEAGS